MNLLTLITEVYRNDPSIINDSTDTHPVTGEELDNE